MSSLIHNDYDYCFKLCITGNSSVGKSSLMFRFSDNEFHEVCLPTIGVDFKVRTIQLNNKFIKLNIWDTAGQERFQSITRAYFKGIHGALFVFDLADRQSFLDLSRWYDKYLQSNNTNSKLILIGNKCDLVSERKVSYEEACELAQSLNMQYIETSAKTRENVEEAFVNLTKSLMEDIDAARSSQSVSKAGRIEGQRILDIRQQKQSTCC